MSTTPPLQVCTLRVDALDEAAVAPWREVLDETEQARADRFMFARPRVQFIAAHALARIALSRVVPDTLPTVWRFVAGPKGKPEAWRGDQPAPVSFNLSHTDGIVGVGVIPQGHCAVGFDVEALDRKVTQNIAGRYFRAEEIAWLESLDKTERPAGFLRLWTLKEAFIKATGAGLSQDLAAFWFTLSPPRIHFTAAIAERSDDWHFEQRIIAGRFIAAAGLRLPGATPLSANWTEATPAAGNDRILSFA